MKVIGVDEHVWRHTRRGDTYVTVIIDLTPVRAGTGAARLLDMVGGRTKQAFATWLAERPTAWRDPADPAHRRRSAHARVVAAALRSRGCVALQVFSPSGRAAAFAASHGAGVVRAGQLVEALACVDVVVACSGSGQEVLDASRVQPALSARSRPLVVLDLALPSDLAASVAHLPWAVVIGLNSVSDNVDRAHSDAVTEARNIVIGAVAEFEGTLAGRQLDPAVIALRRHVSGTAARELARLRAKYPDEVAAGVEMAVHRVTQSLLHMPTLRARELARTGDAADYLRALHTLFGIDVVAAAQRGGPPEVTR